MKSIPAAEMQDVRVTVSNPASDSRGKFIKVQPYLTFKDDLDTVATSINPRVGTIRGLHFQVVPYAEEKIITCIQGSIFDVIVDIRPESKTFGNFASLELNDENGIQLYLPTGVAHGFQTLQPDTIIQYCLSSAYSLACSFSIDPLGELNINWPLKEFLISEKDASGLTFSAAAAKYALSLES